MRWLVGYQADIFTEKEDYANRVAFQCVCLCILRGLLLSSLKYHKLVYCLHELIRMPQVVGGNKRNVIQHNEDPSE